MRVSPNTWRASHRRFRDDVGRPVYRLSDALITTPYGPPPSAAHEFLEIYFRNCRGRLSGRPVEFPVHFVKCVRTGRTPAGPRVDFRIFIVQRRRGGRPRPPVHRSPPVFRYTP